MYFKDQLSNTIKLDKIPKRIISLVPSQTEFLYDLGLEQEVVGITKFCIYPDHWYKNKVRIGGTKNVDIEKIKALKPDLIIGNKEENTETDILELKKIAPVWMSDIISIEDAFQMMLSLGEICKKKEEAISIVNKIQTDFKKQFLDLRENKSCVYLIWNSPLMAVGNTTFINSMISLFGLTNYFESESRYPIIEENTSIESIDFVLLSSEPFPFKIDHKVAIQMVFPNAKLIFVDGEMFSWYGSRMSKCSNYFESILNQFSPNMPK